MLVGTEEFRDKLLKHLEKYIFIDDITVSINKKYDTRAIITDEKDTFDSYQLFIYRIDIDKELISLRCDLIDNSVVYLFNSETMDYSYFDRFKISDENEYISYRIKNNLPEAGKEISEKVTPLDCVLDRFVSYSKGCYIGQEVLMRLKTQNKIPNTLLRFSIETESELEEDIFLNIDNYDVICGFITTKLYENGFYHCLGFIKSKYLSQDSKFFVKENNQNIFINLY